MPGCGQISDGATSAFYTAACAPALFALPTDWRMRTLLTFRVMRKRALRQTLERLAEALGRPYGGTPEAPVPEGAQQAQAAGSNNANEEL